LIVAERQSAFSLNCRVRSPPSTASSITRRLFEMNVESYRRRAALLAPQRLPDVLVG
jgi:hypothetical protein